MTLRVQIESEINRMRHEIPERKKGVGERSWTVSFPYQLSASLLAMSECYEIDPDSLITAIFTAFSNDFEEVRYDAAV